VEHPVLKGRNKMSNATLNARQIRYLNALMSYYGITNFEAIAIEGQVALLYMNDKIITLEVLKPLVDNFFLDNK
jgi:FMN-dependent NADH-azoreductase